MSYHRVSATASARAYLAESEAKDRIAERARQSNHKLATSMAWIDDYRAGRFEKKPFTRFNWAPRWPYTSNIGIYDGKETFKGKTIDGEFAVVAHADAAGKGSGEVGQLGAGNEAAGTGGEAAQESARAEIGYDTPF